MNYWVKSIKRSEGCVSISVFASLVGLSTEIASSTIGLGICVITVAIKKI